MINLDQLVSPSLDQKGNEIGKLDVFLLYLACQYSNNVESMACLNILTGLEIY